MDGQIETPVIESFNSVYIRNTDTLTYTIMVENGTSIDLPFKFEQTALVIDVYIVSNILL